jgi:2-iminobutanoate/2-iminopropanoate deaminase
MLASSHPARVSEFKREVISTDRAPAAVGNYNQAIVAVGGTRTLYASGQIGLVPGKPELGIPGDVAQQTVQVLDNLAAVLEAADMRFANVVRATIYLADMSDFTTVDGLYGQRFEPGSHPARATIQAAALPKGALVEIDVIAVA